MVGCNGKVSERTALDEDEEGDCLELELELE